MRRITCITTILFGLLLLGPAVDVVQACPMCKEANETNAALPRAYMFSILFMLGVPATVLTGFSVGFYRLSKQQQSLGDDESAEVMSTVD